MAVGYLTWQSSERDRVVTPMLKVFVGRKRCSPPGICGVSYGRGAFRTHRVSEASLQVVDVATSRRRWPSDRCVLGELMNIPCFDHPLSQLNPGTVRHKSDNDRQSSPQVIKSPGHFVNQLMPLSCLLTVWNTITPRWVSRISSAHHASLGHRVRDVQQL